MSLGGRREKSVLVLIIWSASLSFIISAIILVEQIISKSVGLMVCIIIHFLLRRRNLCFREIIEVILLIRLSLFLGLGPLLLCSSSALDSNEQEEGEQAN